MENEKYLKKFKFSKSTIEQKHILKNKTSLNSYTNSESQPVNINNYSDIQERINEPLYTTIITTLMY